MVDFFIRRLSEIFKFFLKSLDKDDVSLYYVDVDVCVNILQGSCIERCDISPGGNRAILFYPIFPEIAIPVRS